MIGDKCEPRMGTRQAGAEVRSKELSKDAIVVFDEAHNIGVF